MGSLKSKNKVVLKVVFRDLDGEPIYVGDTVINHKGQKAKLRFGYYIHYIKNLSSPAFGFYFDGDEGFFFSEHVSKNKKLRVRVKKSNRK